MTVAAVMLLAPHSSLGFPLYMAYNIHSVLVILVVKEGTIARYLEVIPLPEKRRFDEATRRYSTDLEQH